MTASALLRLFSPGLAVACLILTAPGAGLAQSGQQNVTGGAQQQAGDGSSGENQYGWPASYVAQVGAGTTSGTTTGYSGTKDQPADTEPSLPELPGPALCDDWKGTEAHDFCMEKLVE